MFKIIVTVVSLANPDLSGNYRAPFSFPTLDACTEALADDALKVRVAAFEIGIKGDDPDATISEPKCVADE